MRFNYDGSKSKTEQLEAEIERLRSENRKLKEALGYLVASPPPSEFKAHANQQLGEKK